MRSASNVLLAALLPVYPVLAIQAPTGTHIQVRFTRELSTKTAKVNDPVEAVVVSPVVVNGEFLVPAGAKVRGVVTKVSESTKPDERSVLGVNFTEVESEGVKHKIAARVSGVDNARESVG